MKCPKCIGKLSPIEISLHRVYKGGNIKGQGASESLTVDQCFICNGLWFETGELEKYMAERITILGASSESATPDREQDLKLGNCPKCNLPMERISEKKDKAVLVDHCKQCDGIWLDDIEIDKLEQANIPLIETVLKSLSVMAPLFLRSTRFGKRFGGGRSGGAGTSGHW